MYWLTWVFFRFLVRPFLVFKWTGTGNVPNSGPVLLASKHLRFWDIPLLAMALNRPVRFAAKADSFENPLKRWYLTKCGSFLAEHGISGGRKTINRAMDLLRAGEIVCVFPEGKLSPDVKLAKLQNGAALIALRSLVPVVPVGISYASTKQKGKLLPKGEIRFGQPIPTIDFLFENRSAFDRKNTEALMEHLRHQLLTLIGP